MGTALIVMLMASAILSDIHKWLLTMAQPRWFWPRP